MTYQNYFNIDGYSSNINFFCGATGDTDWKIWNKPSDSKFVYIIAVGAGGGGSGGRAVASGSLGSGGKGGSPGQYVTTCIPSLFLPDNLYIKVGYGGSGGIGGNLSAGTPPQNGGSGTNTYVSVYPDTSLGNLICACSGGWGADTSSNNISTPLLSSQVTSMPLLRLGFYYFSVSSFSLQGGYGSASGTDFPSTNVSYGQQLVGGGAGGGGVNSAGNSFRPGGSVRNANNINNFVPYAGSIPGGSTNFINLNGLNGTDGLYSENSSFANRLNEYIVLRNPGAHVPSGGAGGGPAYGANVTGGSGGRGGLGCGGGGGGGVGAATGSSFGGNGGSGGDGWVAIMSIS